MFMIALPVSSQCCSLQHVESACEFAHLEIASKFAFSTESLNLSPASVVVAIIRVQRLHFKGSAVVIERMFDVVCDTPCNLHGVKC